MFYAMFTAAVIIPVLLMVGLMVGLIVKKREEVVLCTECQQCMSACPLVSKGVSPVAIMMAAKTDSMEEAFAGAAHACVGCGKCEAVCPRGLKPHEVFKQWQKGRDLTPGAGKAGKEGKREKCPTMRDAA